MRWFHTSEGRVALTQMPGSAGAAAEPHLVILALQTPGRREAARQAGFAERAGFEGLYRAGTQILPRELKAIFSDYRPCEVQAERVRIAPPLAQPGPAEAAPASPPRLRAGMPNEQLQGLVAQLFGESVAAEASEPRLEGLDIRFRDEASLRRALLRVSRWRQTDQQFAQIESALLQRGCSADRAGIESLFSEIDLLEQVRATAAPRRAPAP